MELSLRMEGQNTLDDSNVNGGGSARRVYFLIGHG